MSEIDKKDLKKNRVRNYFLVAITLLLLAFLAFFAYIKYEESRSEESYQKQITQAATQYEQHQYAQSLDSFNKALELRPRSIDPYAGIVKILLDKNRLDEAVEVASQAESFLTNQNLSELYFAIASRYENAGMFDKAVKYFELAGQFDSGETADQINTALAVAYFKNGSIDKGMELAEGEIDDTQLSSLLDSIDALNDSKDLQFDLAKVGYSALNSGYPHLTIYLLDQYAAEKEVELDEYWEAQYYLGRAYLLAGDEDSALSHLQAAAQLGALDGGIFQAIARIYLLKGDTANGYLYYERAVQYLQGDERLKVVNEYASVMLNNKEFTAAGELLSDPLYKDDSQVYLNALKLYSLTENWKGFGEILPRYESQFKSVLTPSQKSQFYKLYFEYLIANEQVEQVRVLVGQISQESDQYDPLPYYLEGKLDFLNGESEGAREKLERSIDLDLAGEISKEAELLLAEI